MRATLLIILVSSSFSLASSFAASAEPNPCDDLYSKRGQDVQYAVQAASCYHERLVQSDDEATSIQESLAHAWVVLHTKDETIKQNAISAGLDLSKKMVDSLKPSGSYWRAVFVTFDCQNQDAGRKLPLCMFKNLGYIQTLLLEAIRTAPATHGYGPDRVYGIMYMQMPKIVGGSYPIALAHLKKSYALAPELSLNSINYAKILIKTGETESAKKILNELIAKTPDQIDISVLPEAIEDQAEARRIIETLK